VLAVSAACTGEAPSAQHAQSPVAASPDAASPDAARPASGTVLQPGKPGQPARTLPPDATVAQARWNAADAAFVRMMIPHHAQALRMCALARTRAQDPSVAAVARRIRAAQAPEIVGMSAWLQANGLTGGMHHMQGMQGMHGMHGMHGMKMSHDPMPGMLSPAQMRALASASGGRFDRLFLAGMIRHHRGALQMASHALRRGSDTRVNEIAADVSAEQSAEIDRMRAIRRQL
jgi:uncharacterized protein (DUF305 family)